MLMWILHLALVSFLLILCHNVPCYIACFLFLGKRSLFYYFIPWILENFSWGCFCVYCWRWQGMLLLILFPVTHLSFILKTPWLPFTSQFFKKWQKLHHILPWDLLEGWVVTLGWNRTDGEVMVQIEHSTDSLATL